MGVWVPRILLHLDLEIIDEEAFLELRFQERCELGLVRVGLADRREEGGIVGEAEVMFEYLGKEIPD